MSAPRPSRGVGIAVIAAVVAAVVAAVLAFNIARVGSDYDDALITYRYAERLADGHGFTYNDGERVLGTSTPLWTLALAGFHRAGVDIPTAADGTNILLAAITAFFLVRFLWTSSRPAAAGAGAILFLLSPLHARAASYGMEATAFSALIACTFWGAASRRPLLTGIATGLSMVLRIEGALLAGAVFLADRFRGRRWVVWAGITLLFAGAWVLAAFMYFGSPLPQSLSAKLLHTHRPDIVATARFLFFDSPVRLAVSVLGFAGAALVGLRYRSAGAMRTPMWFAIAYSAFYLVGRPTAYEWYLPPLHTALIALAAHATGEAFARVSQLLDSVNRRAPFVMGSAALVFGAAAIGAIHMRTWNQTRAWTDTVQSSYIPLTDWLIAHTAPTDTLYCGDIGYVGYLTKRPILDAAALVSPTVFNARRDGRTANELLPELRPHYFIVPVQPAVFPVVWPDDETEAMYVPEFRVPDGPLRPSEAEIRDTFRRRPYWSPEYIVYARRDNR